MSSDTVELGVMERGEASRGDPNAIQVPPAGEPARSTGFQPQDIPHQSTAGDRGQAVQDANAEGVRAEDRGRIGLAKTKAVDPSLNFYRVFLPERALILELKMEELTSISAEMKRLEELAETRFNVKLHKLPRTSPHYQQWLTLLTRMDTTLVEFDMWFLRTKTIVESPRPRESNLSEMKDWLQQFSPGQRGLYVGEDLVADAFRTFGPTKGAIQTFVNEIAIPYLYKLPVLSKNSTQEAQEKHVTYTFLSRIFNGVLFIGVCIFVILPLPLMSYYDADPKFRACMVSVMAFLVCLLLMAEGQNEEHKIALICAYGALMGSFLS